MDHVQQNDKDTDNSYLNLDENTYGEQFIEFISTDFPKTTNYLGDGQFMDIAKAYLEAHPSNNPNAGWFGRHFVKFIKTYHPLASQPETVELITLEDALNTAFDAKDAAVLLLIDLSKIAQEDWQNLSFSAHPSTNRLTFRTNAPEIWMAIAKNETVPNGKICQMPREYMTWRGENTPRFRCLAYDEAMIWDELVKGVTYGEICEILRTYWPKEKAHLKAKTYLNSWLNSEWLNKINTEK